MPIPVFLALTTLGSFIWNAIFVFAGYLLGDNWEEVTGYVDVYSKVVLAATALAVAVFVTVRVSRRGSGGRRRG